MEPDIRYHPRVTYEEFVVVDKECFPHEPVTSRESFSEIVQGEFWGAFADGKLIGFAHVTLGSMGHVHRIAVLPDHRRRHIGSRLLQAGIDLCRAQSVPKVFLSVQTDNTAAIVMYERYGFVTVDHLYQFIAPVRGSTTPPTGTTVPVRALQVTELTQRTRASLPQAWSSLVDQHAPPHRLVLVFVGTDASVRGICRLATDMPGCMPFILEEPSASLFSAVKAVANYVAPDYDGLIMTFPDERIAQACRSLNFTFRYELARMERHIT